MASRSSKRSRDSVSPTRPEAASGSLGAQIPSQNPTLATEIEPDMIEVQQVPQKKQAPNPKSIMSLGLATVDPAERSWSPPGFCEFLKVCRWCNDRIGGESVYMYGNFFAFCKPECREIVISKFYDQHLFESGLADRKISKKDDPSQ